MTSSEDLRSSATHEFDHEQRPSIAQDNRSDEQNPKGAYSNSYVQSAAVPQVSASNTVPSSSYNTQRQPINDAVTSAFHKTDNSVSPDLIHLITQSVLQQLQAHQTPAQPSAQPVRPPQHAFLDQADTDSSLQGSPIISRASVYTPPSPSNPLDHSQQANSVPTMSPSFAVNSHGYKTTRPRDISPASRNTNEEAILSDSDSNTTRPRNLKRSSTDPDATVLEKHWGKLFDEDGHSTEKFIHFLKGIANHLIEEIEPRHSLVITPDKMQKFYEVTKLDTLSEIYPWKLVFDDKTSSISRMLRDSNVRVQHHLVQATPDARPDIPGLTPTGFATWMGLLTQAHPDHEYERFTKILRLMAINHPDERKQRFPAAISRRLFPVSGDGEIAMMISNLMATHCKVHVDSRHNSAAASMGQPNDTQYPVSPRRSDMPPQPTVEDAPDEDHSLSRETSATSNAHTLPKSRKDVPHTEPETTKAASVTSIEDDDHEIPTPKPFERERKPYVAQPGGGKSHDLTGSGDEMSDGRAFPPDDDKLRRTKSVSSPQRPRIPPPIAIHQTGQPYTQQDTTESVRSRSSTVNEPPTDMSSRSRSNSAYAAQPHPFRRSRSNSTYTNDAGPRYHSRRSPSMNKNGPDLPAPRPAALESFQAYPSSASTSYLPHTYPPPAPDRYEQAPRQSYDARADPRYSERERSRDRDQESKSTRPRFIGNPNDGRNYHDDNYRPGQQGYVTSSSVPYPAIPYQFPPSAYREREGR